MSVVDTLLKFISHRDLLWGSQGDFLAFMAHYHSRLFTVRDTLVTPKRFHDWLHEGLLPLEVPEGKKNMMSLPEFVWVKLIDKLRQVGTPLDHIRELKGFLFTKVDPQHLRQALSEQQGARAAMMRQLGGLGLGNEEREAVEDRLEEGDFFSVLEGIGQTVLDSLLIRLLLTPDEAGVMLMPSGYFRVWLESAGEPRMNQTHVYLSISEELSLFRSNSLRAQSPGSLNDVSDEEWQVVWAIRDRRAREVTVSFVEKGERRQIDITTTTDHVFDKEKDEQAIQRITQGKYLDVRIKTQDGKTLFIERKKRKRV
ncbi:hypothetical protein [Pontibacter akesuensis]|uniref:Uncharacterized protein n=1 Tax=Pontibacter akesuensis TaxID=388950 RepID=A0A1I7FL22_9BACT|nr:hypothetical protein [Pontibacter akesuensis]GHA61667.1 hypothetical protein GCM10007389_12720 [Pontibacter akesuensis]SFU36864.1 hypothetical protein SAMN04487941_0287 [Pontibacter akesuensis]